MNHFGRGQFVVIFIRWLEICFCSLSTWAEKDCFLITWSIPYRRPADPSHLIQLYCLMLSQWSAYGNHEKQTWLCCYYDDHLLLLMTHNWNIGQFFESLRRIAKVIHITPRCCFGKDSLSRETRNWQFHYIMASQDAFTSTALVVAHVSKSLSINYLLKTIIKNWQYNTEQRTMLLNTSCRQFGGSSHWMQYR